MIVIDRTDQTIKQMQEEIDKLRETLTTVTKQAMEGEQEIDRLKAELEQANELLNIKGLMEAMDIAKERDRLKAEKEQYYKDYKECYMDLGEMRGSRDEWKRRAEFLWSLLRLWLPFNDFHTLNDEHPEAREWFID